MSSPNCLPLLLCLAMFLLMAGLLCFIMSIAMGEAMNELNSIDRFHNKDGFDHCYPFKELNEDFELIVQQVKYRETWWINLCPGVNKTIQLFGTKSNDAICSCGKGRFGAVVLIGFTGSLQFVIGFIFSILGSFRYVACCPPRRAWATLCGFVGLLFLLCLSSFVLALYYRMNGTASDVDPPKKKDYPYGENTVGIIFTAVCGISMLLNLAAIIMSIVGIIRGYKDKNPTTSMQGQGQRSQNPQTPPPAYSKSQTNSQATATVKSNPSSQISSKH